MTLEKNSWAKISIIIPSFNQGKYIEKTIQSILVQRYPNLELIIIDGGSTDGTVKILKKYSKKIFWKSEKDRGQSDGINKGLKIATGDIVSYLNSDDILLQGSLIKINKIYTETKFNWLTGRCYIINENGKITRNWITLYKNFLLKFINYRGLLIINPISQPATFWSNKAFKEIGFFNEKEHLCMDYEYWLRLGKKFKLEVTDDYLAGFRVHNTSKSETNVIKHFKDELGIARKFSNDSFIYALHYLNYLSIIVGYFIVQPIVNLIKKNE